MNQKDLVKSFINILFILIFSFMVFILLINFLKIFNFINNVNNIIKTAKESSKDLDIIESSITKNELNYNKYDFNVAYEAAEIGYKDALSSLNGSEWGNGFNILLIGSDKKQSNTEKSRSDVIIVLRINKNGKILSISIPRDTLVKITEGPWFGNYDKIGHSLYWGGLEDLKKSVEELIASPIYRVIIIDNFRDIETFLAIIGGINTDKYLYGKLGIQWIRNRNFKDGDIERCKRHQVFIKKSLSKAWKITKEGNYFFSNFFYNTLKKIIYTDISGDELLNMIYVLKKNNFNPDKDFLTCVLPGEFGKYDSKLLNRNNLDCWILNENSMKNLQFIFYSETDDYRNFLHDKVGLFDYIKFDIKTYYDNHIKRKLVKKENKIKE